MGIANSAVNWSISLGVLNTTSVQGAAVTSTNQIIEMAWLKWLCHMDWSEVF